MGDPRASHDREVVRGHGGEILAGQSHVVDGADLLGREHAAPDTQVIHRQPIGWDPESIGPISVGDGVKAGAVVADIGGQARVNDLGTGSDGIGADGHAVKIGDGVDGSLKCDGYMVPGGVTKGSGRPVIVFPQLPA